MDLVPTGEAAKRLGISPRTLQIYVRKGLVEPDAVLPSGHYRWNVERLLEQLRALRPPE